MAAAVAQEDTDAPLRANLPVEAHLLKHRSLLIQAPTTQSQLALVVLVEQIVTPLAGVETTRYLAPLHRQEGAVVGTTMETTDSQVVAVEEVELRNPIRLPLCHQAAQEPQTKVMLVVEAEVGRASYIGAEAAAAAQEEQEMMPPPAKMAAQEESGLPQASQVHLYPVGVGVGACTLALVGQAGVEQAAMGRHPQVLLEQQIRVVAEARQLEPHQTLAAQVAQVLSSSNTLTLSPSPTLVAV